MCSVGVRALACTLHNSLLHLDAIIPGWVSSWVSSTRDETDAESPREFVTAVCGGGGEGSQGGSPGRRLFLTGPLSHPFIYPISHQWSERDDKTLVEQQNQSKARIKLRGKITN